MTIVRVGAALTPFMIHGALLIKHSEYFAKALSGPWKEAEEGVVVLDDVDVHLCMSIQPIHHGLLISS